MTAELTAILSAASAVTLPAAGDTLASATAVPAVVPSAIPEASAADVLSAAAVPLTAAIPATGNPFATDSRPVTVAVDACGGDRAPEVVCAGVRALMQTEQGINIILIGSAEAIKPLADEFPGRIEAVATTESIGMDEHPATAVRQKKDSSIVVGCRLVKEGRADAFFSAGNTGACMAAATLIIGRLKGVARPAILTVIPAPAGSLALLDVGANADVRPGYLLQFAQMGQAYAKSILRIPAPRVGLLNIGSEESKGSVFAQEVYALLAAQLEGFAGNAEGNDFFSGAFDCIVTDGFTGNVALKTMEGMASALFKQLKIALSSSFTAKLGAGLVKGKLMELKESMSADKYGGAPLLGLKKVVTIGHGSSNVTAITNGIRASAEAVRAELPLLIERAVGDKSSDKLADKSSDDAADKLADKSSDKLADKSGGREQEQQ